MLQVARMHMCVSRLLMAAVVITIAELGEKTLLPHIQFLAAIKLHEHHDVRLQASQRGS